METAYLERVHICYIVHLHKKANNIVLISEPASKAFKGKYANVKLRILLNIESATLSDPVHCQLTKGTRKWRPEVSVLLYLPKRSTMKALLSGTILQNAHRGHIQVDRLAQMLHSASIVYGRDLPVRWNPPCNLHQVWFT